jgi:hypothetical protein
MKKCCLVHAMFCLYQRFGAHSLKMKNMLSTMSLSLFNVALHFVDHCIISPCCKFLPMSIQGPWLRIVQDYGFVLVFNLNFGSNSIQSRLSYITKFLFINVGDHMLEVELVSSFRGGLHLQSHLCWN